MKKLLILFFLLVIVAVIVILYQKTKEKGLLSPSGQFFLKTETNRSDEKLDTYFCVEILIFDKDNRLLQEIQTNASVSMKFDVRWQDDDSVLLESSDIGNRLWIKVSDSKWSYKQVSPSESFYLTTEENLDGLVNIIVWSKHGHVIQKIETIMSEPKFHVEWVFDDGILFKNNEQFLYWEYQDNKWVSSSIPTL